MIPNGLQSSGAWVLRSVKGVLAGCPMIGTSGGGGALARPSLARTAVWFVMLLLIPMLLLGAFAVALHVDPSIAGLTLALASVAVPAKKPANIRQMEADFKALAKELEIGQTEMAAGPIPQARGEELEAKAKEMEALQQHLDQYNRVAGIVRASKEVDSPTLPTDAAGNRKTVRTTAGHLFVASEAFRQYRQQGKQGWSANIELKSRLGKVVRLTGEEAVAFEAKAFDAATLSDLGTDAIIEVDRDRDLVRFEEPEVLTMRDVLNVAQTTGDSIKFVKHVSTTRAAESQASAGGLKKFLKVTFVPTTVSVETIAVLSKVTEQDVDDAPRLVNYINTEMSLDIKVEEERQILWGDGADGELVGLFDASHAVPEFDRADVTDTVIDIIRKIRTDLRKKHVTPSFVTVDPLDWETVELSKGSDDRYIWGLITDLRGPRIWSLRVVESDAMTNEATNERRILLGDGVRGATIYDRHDMRLAIGFVDDDFARNLRTLRAEERLALAVKRAFAFEYAITQVAGS